MTFGVYHRRQWPRNPKPDFRGTVTVETEGVGTVEARNYKDAYMKASVEYPPPRWWELYVESFDA